MIVLAFGLALTAALLASVRFRGGFRGADLGSMSEHWVAAYNASQPASSL